MTRTLWDTLNLQETLEALLAEGYTAGEAARALTKRFGISISRNAVIGRAYRTKTALKRAHRRQYTDEQRIAVKLLKEEELRAGRRPGVVFASRFFAMTIGARGLVSLSTKATPTKSIWT